ncbi:protein held out wings isoform X2 [Eurytemora carolleeae]|uniref:protein held out wings isoform X2 n=1 Tax=Eurytemora carolleeae TaxID=1294199 RepID=UPI000C7913C2|nr:protein held out wings isoform X2 [Eurytemora carolleeae]|eukprot:XP_023323335.1 protein held out wings-like isoform X2 [Eurytemora affinis]
MRMGEATNNNTQSIADYLAQLLKDKKQLAAFPNVFVHMERLLDDEIGKVRSNLFQINGYVKEPLILPDGNGPPVIHTEKVYVPVKDHPEFNFVGRILGPRGLTAKQLEQETGCKVMVRGKGSMRDKKKEEQNRGKPNWEHLNDELHVLITVEDCENRATLKLERAVEEVKKLLTVSEGEDELKKRQLMELAIINGTYRDSTSNMSSPGLETQPRLALTHSQHTQLQNALANQAAALRQSGQLGGAPLILSPRLQGLQVPTTLANGLLSNGGPPPLINPNDTQQLLYAQYGIADYSSYAGLTSPLIDYTQDTSGYLVVGM